MTAEDRAPALDQPPVTPALATSKSMGRRLSKAMRAPDRAAWSRTSTEVTRTASAPAARHWEATASRSAAFRLRSAREAPARAYLKATAAPIPREAPVIATLLKTRFLIAGRRAASSQSRTSCK